MKSANKSDCSINLWNRFIGNSERTGDGRGSGKKLDLSQLQTVYASIGEANQYTVYSWRLFTAIGPKTIVPSYYQQATQLLAEGQESQDKTQEQVDQLTSNLQSAMKVLVKKPISR